MLIFFMKFIAAQTDQKNDSLDEFKKLVAKPVGFFLFAENVSGDFNMLFWSDQFDFKLRLAVIQCRRRIV